MTEEIRAKFVTEPIVAPIGQMELMPEGIAMMLDWVRSRAPQCLPDELRADQPIYEQWLQGKSVLDPLFPHNRMDGDRKLTDNELLIELAGRKCYNSFGLKAGRKSNAEYIAHTQQGDVPHACYDETTEVLTEAGWKLWPDVTESDWLATRDAEGRLEYQRPTRLYSGPHSGKMYCVEGSAIDLLVTPNHNMLVCTTSDREGRKRERYELIPAEQLDERSHCYIKDALWTKGDPWNRDMMRLLGFAIGDGYIRDRAPGVLRFHLRRERKVAYLQSVCAALGLDLRIETYDGYSVRLPTISGDMGEHGWFSHIYDEHGEKVIPQKLLHRADRASLEALWEGLMQSDGHVNTTGSSLYSSTSLRLLDQVQQLLLHIGLAGHLHTTNPEECPHVTVSRRSLRPEVNRGNSLPKTKWVNWSGQVYCAEVPNHTLYVRRNGIPVWCGNSILYHAKLSFFIAGVSRRVSHELIRNYVGADRTEEGAPSQESTRYVENAGFYVIPPKYLENDVARAVFESACQGNFHEYRSIIRTEIEDYTKAHGAPPKGIDYKRILEAASGTLIHSIETSFIWTTNPAALAKLLKERDNEAADREFQRFARKWKRIVMAHCPNAFPQPWMREGL